MTSHHTILVCGIILNLFLVRHFWRALIIVSRPPHPLLRGKGILPVIGRNAPLNEALHARLVEAAPQPRKRAVLAWSAQHGPALVAIAIKAAQILAAAAFITAWALALAACAADEPRWP